MLFLRSILSHRNCHNFASVIGNLYTSQMIRLSGLRCSQADFCWNGVLLTLEVSLITFSGLFLFFKLNYYPHPGLLFLLSNSASCCAQQTSGVLI